MLTTHVTTSKLLSSYDSVGFTFLEEEIESEYASCNTAVYLNNAPNFSLSLTSF